MLRRLLLILFGILGSTSAAICLAVDLQILTDARFAGASFERAPWTYSQAPGVTILPSGEMYLFFNGGSPSMPESNWMVRYPLAGEPEFVHIFSGNDQEGETGLYGVCMTPASWPDSKRWILFWSGAWQRDWGQPKPYRVWVGIATAPALSGPWTRKQEGIVSTKNIPAAPPPNEWWPNGTWATAPFVLNGKLYAVVRDNSYAMPGNKVHLIYEVSSDLSSVLVGTIGISNEKPTTWFTDVALDAGNRMLVLDGGDPGQAASRTSIVEYISTAPFVPVFGMTLVPTGRTFVRTTDAANTWDGGYVRDPYGVLRSNLVIGNAGYGGDWTKRGNWWFQTWGTDRTVEDRLRALPLPFDIKTACIQVPCVPQPIPENVVTQLVMAGQRYIIAWQCDREHPSCKATWPGGSKVCAQPHGCFQWIDVNADGGIVFTGVTSSRVDLLTTMNGQPLVTPLWPPVSSIGVNK